eukprot:jgi/Bigna1/129813/aug1.10_g4521
MGYSLWTFQANLEGTLVGTLLHCRPLTAKVEKQEQAEEKDNCQESHDAMMLQIHQCIRRGTLRNLKKLVRVHTQTSGKWVDSYGRTPIMLASMYNKGQMLRYLLTDTDIGINERDNHGLSALHYCCAEGGSSPVKIAVALMKAGADPLQEDDYGITPFHKAVAFNQHQIVREMLKLGVDINIATGRRLKGSESGKSSSTLTLGDTALHLAARKGNQFITKQLLEMGADPKAQNDAGDTPLHDAVRMTKNEITKDLLLQGADPNLKNNCGRVAGSECSATSSLSCLKCQYYIATTKATVSAAAGASPAGAAGAKMQI